MTDTQTEGPTSSMVEDEGPRRYRKFTEAEFAEMEEMARTHTYPQIAEHFGVSQTSIRMAVKRRRMTVPERTEKIKLAAAARRAEREARPTKVCIKCGEDKPQSEYYEGRNDCKPCRMAKQAAYQKTEAGKAANRRGQLKFRYGITPERYAEMVEEQGGRCAICGGASTVNPRTDTWSVDHDHATGAARGLLCLRCNSALGWFETNRDAVSAYLDR